jgi:hypothetical protein
VCLSASAPASVCVFMCACACLCMSGKYSFDEIGGLLRRWYGVDQ